MEKLSKYIEEMNLTLVMVTEQGGKISLMIAGDEEAKRKAAGKLATLTGIKKSNIEVT